VQPAHAPLYEIKADLFKALAHPVRIRVLELLTEADEQPVSHLLEATGLEASHLSQHLAVLRRYGVVTSERRGSAVWYRLASEQIVTLLAAARAFLRENLDRTESALAATEALPAIGR